MTVTLSEAVTDAVRIAGVAASVPLGHPNPQFAAIQRDLLRLCGNAAALLVAEVQGADPQKLAPATALGRAELGRLRAEVEEIKARQRFEARDR